MIPKNLVDDHPGPAHRKKQLRMHLTVLTPPIQQLGEMQRTNRVRSVVCQAADEAAWVAAPRGSMRLSVCTLSGRTIDLDLAG